MSHTTVANYYKKLHVSYRKPDYSYGNKEKNQRKIFDMQQSFCRTLTTYMISEDREIIYIDETTFNLW